MSTNDATATSKIRVTVQLLLIVAVIGAGVAAAAYFKRTAPKTQRRPPAPLAPLVETQTLTRSPYTVAITAMGLVIPAEEMVLKSRVGGQVVRLHPEFTVGGLLKQGQALLQVDDSDYRLAVNQAESRVVDSDFALSLEKGRQAVARREWSLLNGKNSGVDADLALRKPHLQKAEADVAASQAALEQARLDLARTRVTAPFNAMVRSRHVAIGSQIGTQEALAELVGTDRFWVEVSVPIDRLDWIRIPRASSEKGAAAQVFYAAGHQVTATVVRLRGDLTAEGRMARVLLEVRDPLGLEPAHRNQAPLLIGEFVRVQIQGRQLQDVVTLPRTALHDGNTVWLATPEDTLSIRTVTPVWRDADQVVVQEGLADGDRLITTALPAPVEGMPLQTDTVKPRPPDNAPRNAKPQEEPAS
ncbi:MAG: efflux RND transporter periplasmic adaptor subunit [Desulfosarcinaceae bacterium]|nr:efflux RND transporter periplasmic adaptor subunit [Desulfosarcinaceae bacterium]